jgi:hypothetical protein
MVKENVENLKVLSFFKLLIPSYLQQDMGKTDAGKPKFQECKTSGLAV